MKHTNDPIDKALFKLMQESRHKASADFADQLMQQLPDVHAQNQATLFQQGMPRQALPRHIFRPLLSWRAILLFLGTTGAISWLFSQLMAPSTNSMYVNSLLQQYRPPFSFDVSLPDSGLVLSILLAVFLLVGADRLLKRLFT